MALKQEDKWYKHPHAHKRAGLGMLTAQKVLSLNRTGFVINSSSRAGAATLTPMS
jgi:hypothetical protein